MFDFEEYIVSLDVGDEATRLLIPGLQRFELEYGMVPDKKVCDSVIAFLRWNHGNIPSTNKGELRELIAQKAADYV